MSSCSSFTSALPANIPKLQTIAPTRKDLDTAFGREYVTLLIKMLGDVALTFDTYKLIRNLTDVVTTYDTHSLIRRHIDYGAGRDVYRIARLKELDIASGLEHLIRVVRELDVVEGLEHMSHIIYVSDLHTAVRDVRELDVATGLEHLIRTIRVSDSLATSLETVGRVDRQLQAEVARAVESLVRTAPTEVARAVESLVRIAITLDLGVGRSTASVHPISAIEPRLISMEELDAVGHELFTVGYPVFGTPLQDLANAYLRALQQLSTLRHGRYAYAQDWNVLADYAKAIINVLVDQFNKLYEKGVTQYADLYDTVLECHRILSTYKYLKTGNVVMPEHTNTLIDVARCLDFTIELLLAKMKARRITRLREVDVATGLDKGRLLPLILLVDTDDWETASKWIIDGTIVFINYGITAMTPADVRNIVKNKEVAFVVLVDTQPRHRAPAGAFYEVLYTNPNPSRCYKADLLHIDPLFAHEAGFVECVGFDHPMVSDDDIVTNLQKVSNAYEYMRQHMVANCGYVFVKYEKGAIIEAPYDGAWIISRQLDWYIGIIANRLLGEPYKCFVAFQSVKFNRIIWMATYKTRPPEWAKWIEDLCITVEQCLGRLSNESGWPMIDLRKRRN